MHLVNGEGEEIDLEAVGECAELVRRDLVRESQKAACF